MRGTGGGGRRAPVFEEDGLILRGTDLLDAGPRLKAYKERCEARPAFQRALAAWLKPFGQREAEHAGPRHAPGLWRCDSRFVV